MRYYREYVNHMLRFYCRFPKLCEFKNKRDEENWRTTKRVLDTLPEKDKNIIMEVYKRYDGLSDNVYEVSKKLRINQDVIWTLVSKVTEKIAKERGLI